MCRGMPSCPWDVCGGGPGGELVGFLWGTPEVFGGSRSWVVKRLGTPASGEIRSRALGWLPGIRSSLFSRGGGDPRRVPKASAGVVAAGGVRCRS